VIALGEAIALMVLSTDQTPSTVTTVTAPAETATPDTEPPPTTTPAGQSAAPGSAGSNANRSAAANAPPASADSRTATARLGSLRMTSAIPLTVFLEGRLVGTTPGPFSIREGRHQLEVVNDALDFRQTQSVVIRGGQQTATWVAIPNGKISLNATPWAEVTIDGAPVGQTPIANYSLPIGTHEVVFRHPQLGVRRQTVVVKFGATVRVTEAFQQ
jgi:hypothetical protein